MTRVIVLLITLLLAALLLAAPAPAQPKPTLWICWVSGRPDCGTYGWSRDRTAARLAAEELCSTECSACALDYCERH